MKYSHFFAACCAAFLITGCQPKADSGSTDVKSQMTLGVYTIPASAGSASEVEIAIRRLLTMRNDTDTDDIGSVIVTGDGQLLVAAPKEFQKGMAEFVQRLSKTPVSSAKTQHNIRQEFWAVIGVSGQDGLKSSLPEGLESVASAIKAESGDEALFLLEKLSTTTLRDEWITLKGRDMDIEGRANSQNGQILLQTEIGAIGSKFGSKIIVKNGEFIIFGESNVKFIKETEVQALTGQKIPPEQLKLYIVLRASEV